MPIAAPAAPPKVLDCTGVFARDSSHAKVAAAFGARNVAFRTVPAPEGETQKATVVFDKGRRQLLQFVWQDEKRRRRLASVFIADTSGWRTTHGIAVGSSLAEVERINGKPFTLAGFGWDYSGTVYDWEGGTLAKPAGGCRLRVRFEQGENVEGADELSGEKEFSSAHPLMQKVQPKVYDLGIEYD